MNQDVAEIIFSNINKNLRIHLEIPLNLSVNEFVIALNYAYKLQIDVSDIKNCHLKSENPIALLRGNKTLKEFGIRNGSIIYFTE